MAMSLTLLLVIILMMLLLIGAVVLMLVLATRGGQDRSGRPDGLDSVETIERLAALHQQGHLTQEELETQKRRLLE
jgi:hypothetical protein